MKKIKTALISVYYKDGLEELVQALHHLGIQIISTGGTCKFISELGVPVTKIEDITQFPDLFGGRVKTLHPRIMGGILYRRENSEDIAQQNEFLIPSIDLVVVDLYPFEQTLRETNDESEIIEKIDIGGITLIRAAAKNYQDVLVVSSRKQYPELIEILNAESGYTKPEARKLFASYAFDVATCYDAAISAYFHGDKRNELISALYQTKTTLRYGENPHQNAEYFGNFSDNFEQLHGKELSYNNYTDIEAAVELISEFSEPACVIIKHSNACGVALAENPEQAWSNALSCDPLSAYGGIISLNNEVNDVLAAKIHEIFFEVLIAPSFTQGALQILTSKKNRILLRQFKKINSAISFRSCLNGVLLQDKDTHCGLLDEWKSVTQLQTQPDKLHDLILAEKLVKHTKSNAIVIVRNNQLLGSGMGQTSRVDSVRHALAKARTFGHSVKGAVMASDAFFPFTDGIELAFQEGITDIIQPGGSIRDTEIIAFCNEHQLSMIFTGKRHFKH